MNNLGYIIVIFILILLLCILGAISIVLLTAGYDGERDKKQDNNNSNSE